MLRVVGGAGGVKDTSGWLMRIKQDVEDGKKVMVASMSTEMVRRVKRMLSSCSSKSSDGGDVVIYTSTTAVGNDMHFDRMYFYVSAKSAGSAMTAVRMMRQRQRQRSPSDRPGGGLVRRQGHPDKDWR